MTEGTSRQEQERRYGYDRRLRAWVPRDSMLAMDVRIFGVDDTRERLMIRLSPQAHAALAAELAELCWDNDLRTRAELEGMGAPIAEVGDVPTATAAWYAARQAAEDDALVADALLRAARRARHLRAIWEVIAAARDRVGPQAAWGAVQAAWATWPRWDGGAVVLGPRGADAIAVSADARSVLVVTWEGDQLALAFEDRAYDEAELRRAGVLADAGPVRETRG